MSGGGHQFRVGLFAGRVTSAKDTQLKTLQSSSAEAVAHAHAGAERAHAQAALAYREKQFLETEMARAKAHHEQLRNENLALQLVVEKERIARLQLEAQLGPRHIGAAQRQTIQSALAGFREQAVSIVTLPGDPEIAAFAGEIKVALEGSGMLVTVAPALIQRPERGLALDVGANRRRAATALAKALVDTGVCSGPVSAAEGDNPDLLEITAGPK